MVSPRKPGALMDLIPLGDIDELVPSVVAANLQAVVGLTVAVRPALERPEFAFLPGRQQYDAARIINLLAEMDYGAPLRMGITRFDLCLPILTYVFGESQLDGCAAVISTNRLKETNHRQVYERIARVGIHETGHLLGLEHCRQPDCLMRFSQQLAHLDRLPMRFCPACRYETARRLKHLTTQTGIESQSS